MAAMRPRVGSSLTCSGSPCAPQVLATHSRTRSVTPDVGTCLWRRSSEESQAAIPASADATTVASAESGVRGGTPDSDLARLVAGCCRALTGCSVRRILRPMPSIEAGGVRRLDGRYGQL